MLRSCFALLAWVGATPSACSARVVLSSPGGMGWCSAESLLRSGIAQLARRHGGGPPSVGSALVGLCFCNCCARPNDCSAKLLLCSARVVLFLHGVVLGQMIAPLAWCYALVVLRQVLAPPNVCSARVVLCSCGATPSACSAKCLLRQMLAPPNACSAKCLLSSCSVSLAWAK